MTIANKLRDKTCLLLGNDSCDATIIFRPRFIGPNNQRVPRKRTIIHNFDTGTTTEYYSQRIN